MPSNFVHVHTKQMLILSLNCRQEGVGRARFFFTAVRLPSAFTATYSVAQEETAGYFPP